MTGHRSSSTSTAPSAAKPGRTETVVTARGIGMLAAGVALTVLGIGLASSLVVAMGVLLLAASLLAALWLLAGVQLLRRRFRSARRVVKPFPLVAGISGAVTVDVEALKSTTRIPLLDIREQAAPELTGDRPTAAEVLRTAGRVRLRYALAPETRGRWPLGPAVVRVADPFGLAWADTPVGAEEVVPVHPRTIDLAAGGRSRLDGLEQVSRGARRASTDDASVREYRHGDDPRRVHWPSTARRGSLVVRADEHAGLPPASVLFDPPGGGPELEEAVSVAASVALTVLADGHSVRLVGAGAPAESSWAADRPDAARAGLLDACIDLAPAPDAPKALGEAASAVLRHEGTSAFVIAVVEPRGEQDLGTAALSALGTGGRAIALIRAGDRAAETSRALSRAGWRCAVWTDLVTLPDVWRAATQGGGAA